MEAGDSQSGVEQSSVDVPILRDCVESDLPVVQAITAHYVLHSTVTFETEPQGLGYWKQRFDELSQFDLPFLVAEVGGQVVGYAFCSRWRPRPAYRQTVEDSIYVAPSMLGRGLGGLLLPALIDRCRMRGLREIVAVIAVPGAEASIALHRRLGFREVGRLTSVGYKFDRWLDTVLMQLSLTDTP
jgi:L-amino acid N-acyltransferase YncA